MISPALESISLKTTKPFLKWVGGKGRLVGEITRYFPSEYKDYFEPFIGGGAMFFALQPERAVINDLNAVLVSSYRRIQKSPDSLLSDLAVLQDEYWSLGSEEARKAAYLEKRHIYNSLPVDHPDKSALLFFLNKTCFNGMYRENSKGEFNVPFGRHERPIIFEEENIWAIHALLQTTKILAGSYEDAVKDAGAGDLVYFDPPYHPLNTTSSFTGYNAGGFTGDDQIQLRDTFQALAEKGSFPVLSNSNSPFIRDIYQDFQIHEIRAARAINANAGGRGKIVELVITAH